MRGRLFDNIVAEQVPLATAMKPDLISFAGGGNDALRRGFEPEVLVARFDKTIERLRGDRRRRDPVPLGRPHRTDAGRQDAAPPGRRAQHRDRRIGAKHGAHVVNMWDDSEFLNPRLWGIDRLHLSPAGHRRVAGHVLTALGVTCDASWLAAPPPPEDLSWMSRKAADARWATSHLAPWVKRRLTGKSSGDMVTAKRPELAPLD